MLWSALFSYGFCQVLIIAENDSVNKNKIKLMKNIFYSLQNLVTAVFSRIKKNRSKFFKGVIVMPNIYYLQTRVQKTHL